MYNHELHFSMLVCTIANTALHIIYKCVREFVVSDYRWVTLPYILILRMQANIELPHMLPRLFPESVQGTPSQSYGDANIMSGHMWIVCGNTKAKDSSPRIYRLPKDQKRRMLHSSIRHSQGGHRMHKSLLAATSQMEIARNIPA